MTPNKTDKKTGNLTNTNTNLTETPNSDHNITTNATGKEENGPKNDIAAKASNNAEQSAQKQERGLINLLEEGIKDIYSAEKQLLKALPEMAKAAYSEELQDAFFDHHEQTQQHVDRLEKIFMRLRIDREEKNCAAMEGLIEEGAKIISEFERGPVCDAALIIAAQKIEHYEIAAYGSLCELADVLGYHKVADILERTLEEETNTDDLLSDIAADVNDEAYEMSLEEAY